MLGIHSQKCPKCHANFIVDDVDYNFKGNEDDYCYCDNCNINAFIKVRFGRVVKIEFSKEETELVFDYKTKEFKEKWQK